MIRLESVNKYFNRKKKNEIHVINNTSLEMESKGLVTLLGPSGCGKTTLLNVIGGLDKVKSGRVYVDGERITGRRAGKIDEIRNLNIGYIFQNYNLVENMTVFDNVAIALKMVGVKDKDEIREKVNYVLEKVGMYRYRNRYADMLSGGERQRVGIARAIVKNPALVIADEPTGNLDSKNTLEVMNIIKAISQERLVIMVTHEEELANFYASRIIRLLDGKVVSDEVNENADNLDYRVENKIYLRDIKEHKRLRADKYNIDFYNDSDAPLGLDIVIRNGNVYIKTKDDEATRLEVIDSNSSVELVDAHYTRMTKEEAAEHSFDLERLAHRGKRKYKSILNPLSMTSKGFKTVFGYNRLKKILLIGFLVSAVFITYSASTIFGALNITDDEFVTEDKSYITLISKKTSVEMYQKYENDDTYLYVMPGDSTMTVEMSIGDYFQTQYYTVTLTGSLSAADKLGENDLLYGRLPEADNEIIVDKMIIDDVISEQESRVAGYGTVESFLDGVIEVDVMDDLVIVGITDMQSPCIYSRQSAFVNILANVASVYGDSWDDSGSGYSAPVTETDDGTDSQLIDYDLKKSDVSLIKGEWPENDYEVVVNEKKQRRHGAQ